MPVLGLGFIVLLVLAVVGVGSELLMRHTRGGGGSLAAATAQAAPPAAPTVTSEPAADTAQADTAEPCRVVASAMPLPEHVHESSGAAWSPRGGGLLWTHNDSGDPELVGVDERGAERARVRLTGATVTDWEDIAAAPCAGGHCLYVADIGDNKAERRSITIYRVPEPAPGATATAPAEALNATYPDGPQDAEAIFVLPDGTLHVVSKGETGPAALYRYPLPLRPGATVMLEKVAGISTGALERSSRITGASASPDGRWVAVRTLKSLSLYRTQNGDLRALANPIVMSLSGLHEAQGEGVALGDSGSVFLTSEAGGKKNPATLSRLACTLPG
jgi:hypothetical protein